MSKPSPQTEAHSPPVIDDNLLWEMPDLGNKAYWIRQAKEHKAHAERLAAACKSAFDVLRREGPHGFDAAAERLSNAIAQWEGVKQ